MAPTLTDAPLVLPPKLTLDLLADRVGISPDTLRGYLYRGRQTPHATRLLVAAAMRRYAAEVEAVAAQIEGGE